MIRQAEWEDPPPADSRARLASWLARGLIVLKYGEIFASEQLETRLVTTNNYYPLWPIINKPRLYCGITYTVRCIYL